MQTPQPPLDSCPDTAEHPRFASTELLALQRAARGCSLAQIAA